MSREQKSLKNIINTFIYKILIELLPLKEAYKLEYRRLQRRDLNLKVPKRFTEKMFFLTRYNELYNLELIQKIYDKHTVREYVKEKGLENILVKQIGNYTNIDQVDFSALPKQFALKMSQSCGENVICDNKEQLDIEKVKEKFRQWMKQKKTKNRFQGYYFTDSESIVCEELLVDSEGNIPHDFRVCCCNGEPRFIYCDLDSLDENNDKKKEYYRECFDTEWNYLPVDFAYRNRKNVNEPYTKKPQNLDEILNIARILASDFVFVRVDFYLVNDRIYFGELTPIPGLAGGFSPDQYDFIFGDMIKLPSKKIW